MKNRLSLFLSFLFMSGGLLLAQDAQVTISNPDTILICQGDTLQLAQTNNVNDAGLTWSPDEGFIDPVTDPNPRVIPVFSRYYVVTVGNETDGFAKDSIYVDVDRLVVPELISDTLICQGYPLQLVASPVTDQGNTLYNWSPGDFLDDSTDVNSVFIPDVFQDTVFTLVATSQNGVCADTQQVRVDIIRSSLEILRPDTVFRCVGDDSLVLEVSVDPFVDNEVRWFPTAGALSAPSGVTYTVDPPGNQTYYAEAIVNGCPQIDSVVVRLDSLPASLEMTVDPVKDPYCQGDTFTIQSPIYDVGDYPLITHEWSVAPGIASPMDLYNAVFFASDSALVTRITVNGGCVDTVQTQINVIQPPVLQFDPPNPVVCPGESVQINVTFLEGNGTLEWEDPMNTLSCDDCLNPVATVSQSTSYMITVTAEGSECTQPEMYSIQVEVDPQPSLTSQTLLCAGDSRTLVTGGLVDGFTYRVTGGGIDTDDPLVSVTPTEETTYTIETTGNCGTSTQQITLQLAEDIQLTADGPTTLCPGDGLTLTAIIDQDRNGTFSWTPPGGTPVPGQQLQLSDPIPGVYTATFTDALCGVTVTTTTEVTIVDANLNVGIAANRSNGDQINPGMDAIFSGNVITLTVTGVPEGLAANFNWSGNLSPADGSGRSIEVRVPDPGQASPGSLLYTLTVVTDEGGCEFTAAISIPITESEFEIPELISPNSDGTNDLFRVFYAGEVTDFSLTIFNRWGQKVFTSNDIDEGWDGTINGTPQNIDTYLYITKFRLNGTEVEREGQFDLIR
ncbi:gliding motility-associated C-terminal domain-containing protein [Lewinella sp. W8]|uniref:gliding motility-associated C-terminal domain-containing protein n=1 Tax=Lewinella sp. W8 TaxID=2528208 RepID=UPI00106817CE|nr:gliding motility-associated C-terminal domain-containing protein [Lewinella sp. W8]MTB53250.1 T9SS type B sorting domain-containing protein [Lewinella sp. W8]